MQSKLKINRKRNGNIFLTKKKEKKICYTLMNIENIFFVIGLIKFIIIFIDK